MTSLQRGQSWCSRTQKARFKDVSPGRRPALARTASCCRRASSTRACSRWLRKQARSERSRAIAKESRAVTVAASLRDPAARYNAVGARGPCGTLACRSPQERGEDRVVRTHSLHGHEWGNPGYRQGHRLTDHRASPRPYQPRRRAMPGRIPLAAPAPGARSRRGPTDGQKQLTPPPAATPLAR